MIGRTVPLVNDKEVGSCIKHGTNADGAAIRRGTPVVRTPLAREIISGTWISSPSRRIAQ